MAILISQNDVPDNNVLGLGGLVEGGTGIVNNLSATVAGTSTALTPITPTVIPPTEDKTIEEELNFQPSALGFDSYLNGIIPQDQAITAGALSISLQQVRNIINASAPVFAKVVYNMESTKDLPLVNGTDIPTNTPLATSAFDKQALGSGLYGTYTMSNFYGAMSGLPYSWKNVYNGIKNLQTTKLRNIYQELYLAVQWEGATATVQYVTGSEVDYVDPGPPSVTYYKWYWQITGITLDKKGGGYGRGTAPAPNGIITGGSGATADLYIGADPANAGSNGGGEYGRATQIVLTNAGSHVYYASGQLSPSPGPVSSPPLAEIECPPTDLLPVQVSGQKATNGVNTPYGTVAWPNPMNNVSQGYINQANTEISETKDKAANAKLAKLMNAYWDITGTALKHEQRARYIAVTPVPVPYDRRYAPKPTSINTFVDSIPSYSGETLPNMTVQTLEHISNINTVGGQSIIALLRQARNQSRLAESDITLDDNIPTTPDGDLQKQLMLNGTVPGAVEGIPSPNGEIYTIPADAATQPYNYYEDGLKEVLGCAEGSILPIIDGSNNPIVNNCTPIGPGPEPPAPINPFVINPNVLTFPVLNVNTDYTATTLQPSIYNVPEAIAKVVECNCDCWVK